DNNREGVLMGVGLVPIKKHTELTDKEVAGVIDHADGSVDLLTKGTYVPVNKAGDTMTGNLVPDPTDAHDFGSAAKRWRNLHLGGDVYSDNTIPGRITIPSSNQSSLRQSWSISYIKNIRIPAKVSPMFTRHARADTKPHRKWATCSPVMTICATGSLPRFSRTAFPATDLNISLFWTRSSTGSDESGKTVKWEVKYLPINGIDENCNTGESTLSVQDTYDSASTTDQIVYATDGIT
ncbi:unnamed protein product, partial [marine sediment metagenome]